MSSPSERIKALDAKIKRYEDALEGKGDSAKREHTQAIRDKIEEMKAEKKKLEEAGA